MKKFLSTLLVLAMVLSMAACGGGSGTSTPTSTPAAGSSGGSASSAVEGESDRSEKMKISVALWDAETVDDKVGQFVQDKLNVEFDLQPLSWDNPEQVSLFGATDSLPDVTGSYPTNEMSMFYSWIEQGIIRDIPYEMIEKYPYIKEIVDNDVVLNAVKEVQGGKYWYLPRPESFENIYQATTTGIYYRKDWLENVGIEKAPETVDEFYEMLVAFKEKDPDGNGKNDTVPLSMQKFVSDTTPDLLFGFWGLADPMSWYKTDDGTWQPGYFTDAMLEPLKFYRKLYQEGLIDTELYTQDSSTWEGKGSRDLYGVSIAYGSNEFSGIARGPEKSVWDVLPVLNTENGGIWLRDTSGFSVYRTQAVITNKAEHPEIICRWFDNAFALENGIGCNRGPVGVIVNKEDDGYHAIDTTTLSEEDQEKYSWGNLWPQSLPKYLPVDFEFVEEHPMYDEKKATEEAYEANLTKEIIPSYWIDLDKIDTFSDTNTAIKDFFEQQQAQFVCGELDIDNDADWQAYVDGMYSLGLEDWVATQGIEEIAK